MTDGMEPAYQIRHKIHTLEQEYQMRKIFLVSALAAALTTLTASAMAEEQTLTFDGNVCGVGGFSACSDGLEFAQSYGDIAGLLDISHRTLNFYGGTYEPYLSYWSTDWSGTKGIASGPGYAAELSMMVQGDMILSLDSINFRSAYFNSALTSATIIDAGNGATLWSSSPFIVQGNTVSSFTPNVSSDSGLILRWETSNAIVGLDSIHMTLSEPVPELSAPLVELSPVPEPETYALMLAGLGLVGFMARSRVYRG